MVEVEKIVEVPYEVVKYKTIEVPTERVIEVVKEKEVPIEKEVIKFVPKIEV